MRVISGSARGVQLRTLDGTKTRPTADRVKEAMFSIIHFDLPGTKILDLFAGSGQLGIEALSRGAKSGTFVDESQSACGIIKDNLLRTDFMDRSKVICSDYYAYLKNSSEKYDIILLDPPYAKNFLENSLNLITEIDILQSGGIIVTERPLGKELPFEYSGFVRSKDYKYGNTLLTIFRKNL